MRGAFLVVLLAYVAAVIAESEPYFSNFTASGSGDVVYIPPTNATIDSTDDDGSGVDDEDGSGSAVPTKGYPTIEQKMTEATTETETEATTESPSSTRTMSPTQQRMINTDDEDFIYSGSGSGGSGVSLKDDESTTSSTDVYIDASTTDNTLIINRPKFTTESTPSEKISTRAPNTDFKTDTPSFVLNEEVTNSEIPSTDTVTQVSTESMESKTGDLTTQALDKTTTRVNTKGPDTEERNTDLPIILFRTLPPKPSGKSDETTRKPDKSTTTAANNPNVLGLAGKKEDKGFTLTTEVIAGVVGCALLALLLIAFLMYRLKKRDEGSYLLDESNSYPVDYKKMHESDKEAFI